MIEKIILHLLKNVKIIFAYKVVCTDDRFSNNIALYRQKMQPKNFTKQFLKNKKKINNKNLVMSAEDETRFQSCNKCSICKKLFVAGDDN